MDGEKKITAVSTFAYLFYAPPPPHRCTPPPPPPPTPHPTPTGLGSGPVSEKYSRLCVQDGPNDSAWPTPWTVNTISTFAYSRPPPHPQASPYPHPQDSTWGGPVSEKYSRLCLQDWPDDSACPTPWTGKKTTTVLTFAYSNRLT